MLTDQLKLWRKAEHELSFLQSLLSNYEAGLPTNEKFEPVATGEELKRWNRLKELVEGSEIAAASAFAVAAQVTNQELIKQIVTSAVELERQRQLNAKGIYRCFCGDPIRVTPDGAVWSLGGMYHRCPEIKAPNSFRN